jgi:type II secretory pathway pseudopilin PulG
MARAITLVELLFAVSLMSLVVLSAGAFYSTTTVFFLEIKAQSQMQNEANYALQHIVRNISLAENVSDPGAGSSSITVTRLDGIDYNYWQDGSDIKYNGGGSNEIIAKRVQNLIFSGRNQDPTSKRITLTIELTMQGNAELKLLPLSFTTQVTLRRYE